MTDRERVPTEGGRFVAERGVFRVRTTPRGVVRNVYLDGWKGKDKLQQGWFVFSAFFAVMTLGRFVSEWLGFSGRPLSVGFVLSALLVYALFLALKLALGRLRDGVSIPLRTVREVERGNDPTKLEVVHGEFGNVERTTIAFPGESDADAAVELLRWKGIRIAEVGERRANLREDIERRRKREVETN
ncbi:hypothetical protein [Haladaptatus salinisoli]|uniref:hypothetical protein n=1 Tax=Haladaptatus salinisoli TaxID=2884876 RepID=UPI001D0B5FC9|nr:hypothetical protein [Haladaptatus salinisoli]